jgi:hypothetical protein
MKKERNQNVDIFPLLYAYWHIVYLLHVQLDNDEIVQVNQNQIELNIPINNLTFNGAISTNNAVINIEKYKTPCDIYNTCTMIRGCPQPTKRHHYGIK